MGGLGRAGRLQVGKSLDPSSEHACVASNLPTRARNEGNSPLITATTVTRHAVCLLPAIERSTLAISSSRNLFHETRFRDEVLISK